MADPKIKAWVKKNIEKGREENHIIKVQLKKDLKKLKTIKDFTFEVYVKSLWEDHGGVSVTKTTTGTLRQAIKEAVDKFKETNNSGGGQWAFSAWIILPNGTRVYVPEKFRKKFQDEFDPQHKKS